MVGKISSSGPPTAGASLEETESFIDMAKLPLLPEGDEVAGGLQLNRIKKDNMTIVNDRICFFIFLNSLYYWLL